MILRPLLVLFFVASVPNAPATARCPSTDATVIGEVQPGVLKGYLDLAALFDSAALLAPPPANDTPAQRLDDALSTAIVAAASAERVAQAAQDADLRPPSLLAAHAAALGFEPTQATTPHLATLLRRVATDAGMATVAAKKAHARDRPFEVQQTPSCTPDEDAKMAQSGSFPSGHAAMGWAMALVLAEVAPERAGDFLARGLAFGESRVVCRAHWSTDVDAGRVLGAGVVALLHADATFAAQLREARHEIAKQRGHGGPVRDEACR